MKRLIQLLSLSVLLSAALAQADGFDVDVFLLGGQSNAGGRGVISELPDSSVLYNTGIMLYHSASMNSGQPARQWTTLRPASNSAGNFGPEIGFGNRMAELHPGRQIAIIKHAVGGTDLGANWNPGTNSRDMDHFGPQLMTFVETVDSGIDSLIAQGYTPVIRGMLWQQGERDARNSSYGPAYDRNLSHFIRRVRTQFNASSMPFVYGQVLPVALSGYAYRDQVRQGQFNVDEDSGQVFATDGARLVMADDLPMNSDNLHISAAGQLELGIRFADALASVVSANAVDFNADRRIDSADVSALIDHWHQDEPAYDIAPPPFGDGIVDVQDLIIVADHLFQEIPPSDLIAYWKLDEVEGGFAYDSIGLSDGTLSGDPQWESANGKQDGALRFDGTDDFASTPFVLDPSLGSFSVFAWVKGGVPGQVIISQQSGVNWLMADIVDGALRTDLKKPGTMGRNASPPGPPLVSSTIVTDGNWHRIGSVTDGSNRILYVDGVEVAGDIATGLEPASEGLHIGAGGNLESGSFFSGLIDDVRVYETALSLQEITALTE
jgi:hypothetical protein